MPIRCHAVTLTFDLLTLKIRGISTVTYDICTKLSNSRLNY